MCTLKPGSEVCIQAINKASDLNKASGCPAVNCPTSCGCLSIAPTKNSKKTAAETAVMLARKPKQLVAV